MRVVGNEVVMVRVDHLVNCLVGLVVLVAWESPASSDDLQASSDDLQVRRSIVEND